MTQRKPRSRRPGMTRKIHHDEVIPMRCEEKRRFLSESAASFQFRQIRASKSRRMKDGFKKRKLETTHPYLCWKCGFWHLGSSKYVVIPPKYNKVVDADHVVI